MLLLVYSVEFCLMYTASSTVDVVLLSVVCMEFYLVYSVLSSAWFTVYGVLIGVLRIESCSVYSV